jgi:tRNA1(Val) A37 N6-methylase TrmN6
VSLCEEKTIAKHEIKGDIFDIMRAAGRVLKKDGRACFIYPVKRKGEFDMAAEEVGLKPGRLRFVHPRAAESARWVLAECRFDAPSLEILPPLFIYEEGGDYTPEMKALFAGEDSAPAS